MGRKKIKSSWKEYFNFSARERRGAIFLSGILILQIAIIFFIRNRSQPVPFPDREIIMQIVQSFKNDHRPELTATKSSAPIQLFNFDPNVIGDETWISFGLSPKQTEVIRRYLNRGGKFRVRNDLKKMYCISEEKYRQFEPFLLLPDSMEKKSFTSRKTVNKKALNINEADSAAFERLRGIGPVLASRIIKFRERLGGFYSIEQIKEVWGFNDTLFHSLLPDLEKEELEPFRFIHLNTDSFDMLSSHPYIKFKLAGLICNYRRQHESFKIIGEVKSLPLVTEENFVKLAPYLRAD